MGDVPTWMHEDDLLLIDAIKAGASLESFDKSAVQLSRRFTLEELQDRWHTLLYDPVVSAEASPLVMEFEHSALTTQCESNRFEHARESKNCVPEKRKAESMGACNYAMCKRISSGQYDSVEVDYPGGAGINEDPKSVDCMFVDSLIDNFGNPQSNHNIIPSSVLEHGAGNPIYASDSAPSSSAYPIGQNHYGDVYLRSFDVFRDFLDGVEETFPLDENHTTIHTVRELFQPNELPICELFEAAELEPNMAAMAGQFDGDVGNASSGYESQVCTAAFPDSDLSFHDFGYSPRSIIEGASLPTLPDFDHAENERSMQNTLAVPVHSGVSKMDTSECGIDNSSSIMEDQISCDILSNLQDSTDVSNSLFNSKDDQELLYLGLDGDEMIDNSHVDAALISFLLGTPHENDMPDKGASEYGIDNSSSDIEDQISCDILRNLLDNTDDEFLAELSNSLVNFKDDEELFLMGLDGDEMIDNSHVDAALVSFFLDTPHENDMLDKGASEYGIDNSSSDIEDQISCDILRNLLDNTDYEYLAELSNSLVNFKDDEELLFMGLGDEMIEISNAPDQQLPIPIGSHPSDKSVNQYGDNTLVCTSEVQMLSSALAVCPDFPETRGGVIYCTLNRESREVPTNDDVFLPIRMPTSSSPVIAHQKNVATCHLLSSVNTF